MDGVFVGRQPIYRDEVQVIAYELLFRDSNLNEAAFSNGDRASAQVLLNTVVDIGLNRVVGPHLAYFNASRNLLCSDYCALLPRDRVVLEVLEDVIPDAPLVEALSKLATMGYQIALDDFVYHDRFRPLLEVADVVKVDIRAHGLHGLQAELDHLRKFRVKLLAEKVETHEEFEFCRQLGFDYFQGYFFCKPQIMTERTIPINRLASLTLLAKLMDPQLSMAEIAEMVQQDVAVSYKLLLFINSALHSLPRKVESVRHAVQLVGTQRIRNWAGLIIFAGVDDKPRELMTTAVVRARMCELLAGMLQQRGTDQFFTAGLFSVLDALLDRPMAGALELLPLSAEVNHALLDHSGPVGEVLECVLSYEQGDWEGLQCRGLDSNAIQGAYVGSVEWTRTTTQQLSI